jgi:hypothetical protein
MVCSRKAKSTPTVVFCESAGPGLPCGSLDSAFFPAIISV